MSRSGSASTGGAWARAFRFVARTRETGWSFAVVVTLVYLGYLISAHWHHEFWRDEIHSWSLARSADGFVDLVTGDRIYEGHPPLWFWYLRLWSFVVRSANGLHLATIAAMTAAALLFLRFAPFARALKVLLLFSYFLAFEYGVMSRNYTLDWLLVVIFCAALHPLRPRFIALAIVLGLLCITSAYGALLAAGLALAVLPLGASLRAGMKARVLAVDIRATPRLAIALVVLAAALAFSIYSTSPPDPNPFSPGWNLSSLSGSSFVSGLDTILYTFLPVRSFLDAEYWSHTDTFWRDHHAFVLPVSIALGLVLALSLAPRWSHVIAFVMTGVLIVAFQLARYPGAMRHWGHLFMLLIALTWIGRLVAPRRRHVLSSVLLVAIGLFQAESFLAAAWRDRSDAFAAGKATADFIRQAGLQDLPIVAGPAYFVLPVTGYLDRPFISSESEEVSQTVVFHNRKREFSEATLLAFAADVAKRKHSPVLVVSDRPLHAELAKGAKLSPLYHYPGVLCMTNERFFVYKLQL